VNLGLIYAIAANLIWGLVFLGPVWVPGTAPLEITSGRYALFGAFSVLCLALVPGAKHARVLRAPRAWLTTTGLALLGNFVYFMCVSVSVQRAGIALPTMIIGMIPVTVPVLACLWARRWPGPLLWLALALMAAGIVLANLQPLDGVADVLGVALAIGALLCWSLYALLNQAAMRHHAPGLPLVWSSMQGAVGLPIGLTVFFVVGGTGQPHFAALLPVWLVLGLLCSGIGNLLWNAGSARLPSTVLGPMIAFETISGLTCARLYSGQPWPWNALAGAALLLVGVVLAVRSERQRVTLPEPNL
jgi:drug/metabolite transporter (DMT)-like permease